MLGTLNGALVARGIDLPPADITARVEGRNELVDGIITLTGIDIAYRLRIPAGTREAVERALARHQEKCPTARSLQGAVTVRWSADIAEVEADGDSARP